MFEMVTPRAELKAGADHYGRFSIEPLESGFGTTIGNAMRRVLLSSLPGAAVTWVKIDGVQHEFSTIPHVKEDTTELLLNVKGLRLRALSDRPGTLILDVAGEGVVTAADIQVPVDFELVNPDLYLATLDSPEARLYVEFNVEQGRGYEPAGRADGLGIGVIPVDALFTPVTRVNYTVEPVRIGVENYDRLILEVWTDRTIGPSEAVSQAASILVEHFLKVGEVGKVPARFGDRQPLSPIAIPQKQYDTPIEELDLSVRAYNCLKRAGITKVGQVLEMSEEDLLNVRNFGRKSLDELRERLTVRGFITAAQDPFSGSREAPLMARSGGR